VNARKHTRDEVMAMIEQHKPAPCQYNISANNDVELNNVKSVRASMDIVLRTPVVIEGAVMPDACTQPRMRLFSVYIQLIIAVR